MCPHYFLWKYDIQYDHLEYHAPDTVSLGDLLLDGNGILGDYFPDSKPSMEDIIAERDLLKRLIPRLHKLNSDTDHIIQMRLDNPKTSWRKIAESLGRQKPAFANKIKRDYTELYL